MTDDALLTEREAAILRWRCRRGLVENDLFLERFFSTYGNNLKQSQAQAMAALMDLSDNDLLDLLLRRKEAEGAIATPEIQRLLEQMRTPHAPSSPHPTKGN